MTNGPLAGKIILFSLPLIASGMLQLLFNAADVIVVGQYVGSDALAAVSSNTSLINLIINLFVVEADAHNHGRTSRRAAVYPVCYFKRSYSKLDQFLW